MINLQGSQTHSNIVGDEAQPIGVSQPQSRVLGMVTNANSEIQMKNAFEKRRAENIKPIKMSMDNSIDVLKNYVTT